MKLTFFIGASKSMEFDAFSKNRTIMTKMKENREIKYIICQIWRMLLKLDFDDAFSILKYGNFEILKDFSIL